jgi:acyl-CoA thioester hydrolase
MTPHKPRLASVAQLRVLYADTDQMGVVNNVVYLRWLEIGRAEWLRQRGRPYKELERAGYLLPVIEAHLRYREPARYDDIVDVAGAPTEIRAASVKFEYQLRRAADGVLLCEGWTTHACVSPDGKVRRFPPDLTSLFHSSPG